MASAIFRSVNPLYRTPGQVSSGHLFGQYVRRRFGPIASLFSRAHSKTASFSRIIIVSLSYPNSPNGTSPTGWGSLQGPKFDFHLLLKRYGYQHDDTSGRFTLVVDFDSIYTDSKGVKKVIPKSGTSPEAIETAIKNAMRKTKKNSQVLFYYGGHGTVLTGTPSTPGSTSEKPPQAIIAGNGEPIQGSELLSWMSAEAGPGTSVTAVFDACTSAGILGLPFRYEYLPDGAQIEKVSGDKSHIEIIEISAARLHQQAYSNTFEEGYHGQLTWCLTQYFTHTASPTVEGLISHLHRKCDPSGHQLPQVHSSLPLKGWIVPL